MKSILAKKTKRRPVSSVSKSHSLAEIAEFWDTHDITDFPTRRVKFTVNIRARKHYVAVDTEIISGVQQVAQMRGLTAESLVNLWLQEKLLTLKVEKSR